MGRGAVINNFAVCFTQNKARFHIEKLRPELKVKIIRKHILQFLSHALLALKTTHTYRPTRDPL